MEPVCQSVSQHVYKSVSQSLLGDVVVAEDGAPLAPGALQDLGEIVREEDALAPRAAGGLQDPFTIIIILTIIIIIIIIIIITIIITIMLFTTITIIDYD